MVGPFQIYNSMCWINTESRCQLASPVNFMLVEPVWLVAISIAPICRLSGSFLIPLAVLLGGVFTGLEISYAICPMGILSTLDA